LRVVLGSFLGSTGSASGSTGSTSVWQRVDSPLPDPLHHQPDCAGSAVGADESSLDWRQTGIGAAFDVVFAALLPGKHPAVGAGLAAGGLPDVQV
ncbi:MAG: hypothetical protein AAFN18_22750, partial [Cyanobacteria bacterium J06554_6]